MPPSQKTLKRRQRRRAKKCAELIHQFCHLLVDQAERCFEEDRIKSPYDGCGGGEWVTSEQVVCGNHHHQFEACYVRNPRDINLTCWFVDGKQMWQMAG